MVRLLVIHWNVWYILFKWKHEIFPSTHKNHTMKTKSRNRLATNTHTDYSKHSLINVSKWQASQRIRFVVIVDASRCSTTSCRIEFSCECRANNNFYFVLLFYPSDYTLCVFLLFSVCFHVLLFIYIKQQRFLFLFALSVCLLFNCVVFRLSLRWKIKQFNPTTVFFVPIFPVAVLGFSGEWNYDEHEK